jgi:hypothetical protein
MAEQFWAIYTHSIQPTGTSQTKKEKGKRKELASALQGAGGSDLTFHHSFP